MHIQIALCGDGENIREHIAGLISKQWPDCAVSHFSSGEELIAHEDLFDIVILDVQMIGMDGFDTARLLRARQPWMGPDACQIIFITSQANYMAEAFDVNVFHYLLKPLDEAKFRAVLDKALQLLKSVKYEGREPIAVKTIDKDNIQLYLNQIKYIESDNKLLIIHTLSGTVTSRGQISHMENILSDHFFRCHRSIIVNLDMVAGFTQGTVKILGGEQVLMARKNYRALADLLLL